MAITITATIVKKKLSIKAALKIRIYIDTIAKRSLCSTYLSKPILWPNWFSIIYWTKVFSAISEKRLLARHIGHTRCRSPVLNATIHSTQTCRCSEYSFLCISAKRYDACFRAIFWWVGTTIAWHGVMKNEFELEAVKTVQLKSHWQQDLSCCFFMPGGVPITLIIRLAAPTTSLHSICWVVDDLPGRTSFNCGGTGRHSHYNQLWLLSVMVRYQYPCSLKFNA